jgi:hypothetical protein
MLWYKGWLETRFRLLFVLGFGAFFVFLATHTGNFALTPGQRLVNGLSTYWWAAAVMLAGAGIKTQAAFQATRASMDPCISRFPCPSAGSGCLRQGRDSVCWKRSA